MFFGDHKLINAIPSDSCMQVHPHFQLQKTLLSMNHPIKLLDLGCGTGNTRSIFNKYFNAIEWFGLDIESSPEVNQRNNTGEKFYTFDGINIPFDDDFFDIIYSNQALEHVMLPFDLIKDVTRVLKKGGYFIGSVSYMELYHSYSVFNYTPLGLKSLLENNGLLLKELRPGPDVFTMLFQRIFSRFSVLSKVMLLQYDNESIVNRLLTIFLKSMQKDNTQINLCKLLFSGHIRFLAQKVLS